MASALETSTAAADTGCDPADAPAACGLPDVAVQPTGFVGQIASAPIAVPTHLAPPTHLATNSVTSLVNTTVRQANAVAESAAPTSAPAIKQVGSAVQTTTAAVAKTVDSAAQNVDTVARDTVTTASRTLDNPITKKLTGTVSAIAPVVSATGLQPHLEVPGVATITATVPVSTDSETSPAPLTSPDAPRHPASSAPQTAPAAALPVPTAAATPASGGSAFCVSGPHGQTSFQRSTATATPAGIGSQRPADPLPLDLPTAPIGAVGSGSGTSSAGSGSGDAQGAIVLSGRTARDQRLACWGVNPDDVAPLRMRAQQPPVSPD